LRGPARIPWIATRPVFFFRPRANAFWRRSPSLSPRTAPRVLFRPTLATKRLALKYQPPSGSHPTASSLQCRIRLFASFAPQVHPKYVQRRAQQVPFFAAGVQPPGAIAASQILNREILRTARQTPEKPALPPAVCRSGPSPLVHQAESQRLHLQRGPRWYGVRRIFCARYRIVSPRSGPGGFAIYITPGHYLSAKCSADDIAPFAVSFRHRCQERSDSRSPRTLPRDLPRRRITRFGRLAPRQMARAPTEATISISP